MHYTRDRELVQGIVNVVIWLGFQEAKKELNQKCYLIKLSVVLKRLLAHCHGTANEQAVIKANFEELSANLRLWFIFLGFL